MIKPYMVGIAGGSASGKSTLCEKLENFFYSPETCGRELKLKSFHMDKYFKPKDEIPRAKAFVSGIIYSDHNHPLTADLPRLKNDLKELTKENYDIVIIEGLLTLWDDDIYAMLDLKLFIDCESDERIVRRIKRNMQKGATMDEVTGVFLDMVRFRHREYVEPSKWRADIIMNGSSPSETSFRLIAEFIRNNYNKDK